MQIISIDFFDLIRFYNLFYSLSYYNSDKKQLCQLQKRLF